MAVNLSFIGGAGWQFFNNNGIPLSGGKIYTYAAGTTTPQTTFTGRDGLTANTNPIILDAAGRTPAQIWSTEGLLYKYTVTTATDVSIRVWDNIGGSVVASNLAQDLAAPNGATLVGFTGFKGQVGTVSDIADNNGANWIGYAPAQSAAISRSAQDKMRDMVSVKDFGAVGDGVADDTAAFQALATECDVGKATYFYVPNFNENYYIDDKIIFNEPGVKVFGFAGGTYNRGIGKNGKIIIGPNAPYAFDFGNERTTGNPADNWSISNVAFIQATGVTANTKYGIALTSKTNGPDRGAIVRECSASGLAAGVYVPDLAVATRIANLIVENCCFSNNGYALYAPNANIFGARIVGNQMEQNAIGAIHGAFNASVLIADNMLEGQNNTINITVPSITGNRPCVVIERNYFEANAGDYLIQYQNVAKGQLIVKNNFFQIGSPAPSDIVRLLGGRIFVVINENSFGDFPITFSDSESLIEYGSQFLVDQSFYRVRRITSSTERSCQAIISDYSNFVDSDGLNTHVTFGTGTQFQTPYGLQFCVTGGGFVDIPMAVNNGDLFTLNVLCKQGTEVVETQVWNAGTTAKLWEGNPDSLDLQNRWALVSITGRANQTTANIRLRFLGAAADSLIAGVAARNYGTHANDGTAVKNIYPVVPNL